MPTNEVDETPDLLDRLPTNLALGKLSISVLLTRKPNDSDIASFNKLAQKEFKFTGSNQKIDFPVSGKLRKSLKQQGCQGLHFGIFLGLEKT